MILNPGTRIRNKLTNQVGLLENTELEPQTKEKIKGLDIKHPYYYLIAVSILVKAKDIKLRLRNGNIWSLDECEVVE